MAAGEKPRRVVLVTGSSSGIGRACAERLAASGRTVYGGSRSRPPGMPWPQLSLDVTDEASVNAAIAEIETREGRLDAVVHCAGVSLIGPLEETSLDEARQHLDVNYFGSVRVLRAALPIMRRQGHGKLIVVGSIAGLIGLPFAGQYSASKFALDGLIEAVRPELRPFGIEATIVHPGDFNTEITANRVKTAATKQGSPYFEASEKAAAFYDKAEMRARKPEPVARAVDSLLERRRLPVRVIVGTPLENLGVLGKKALPSRVFEFMLGKVYGG